MKTPLLAAAVLLGLTWPARVSSIELELEQNKAERGNIGFVDTQRLFKLFPETIKAKENFEETVRQAEDQVNLRKAEVLRLRKDINDLKVERLALMKSPPTASAASGSEPSRPASGNALPVGTPPAVSTRAAAAVSVAASTAAVPVAASTAAVHLPGFTGVLPMVSSAAASQPLVINLPGATTGPVEVAPPTKASAPPVVVPKAPAQAAPTAAAAAQPAPPARGALDAALAALDEKTAQKTRELERKQAQLREEQDSAEKNLLDLESRRSEILLGKIYKAVQEVARREGVSVVVDKTGILYGHNAVDLTDKVLKYLKGG
jgi:Skp family chaperone for outer membrane proteins